VKDFGIDARAKCLRRWIEYRLEESVICGVEMICFNGYDTNWIWETCELTQSGLQESNAMYVNIMRGLWQRDIDVDGKAQVGVPNGARKLSSNSETCVFYYRESKAWHETGMVILSGIKIPVRIDRNRWRDSQCKQWCGSVRCTPYWCVGVHTDQRIQSAEIRQLDGCI